MNAVYGRSSGQVCHAFGCFVRMQEDAADETVLMCVNLQCGEVDSGDGEAVDDNKRRLIR